MPTKFSSVLLLNSDIFSLQLLIFLIMDLVFLLKHINSVTPYTTIPNTIMIVRILLPEGFKKQSIRKNFKRKSVKNRPQNSLQISLIVYHHNQFISYYQDLPSKKTLSRTLFIWFFSYASNKQYSLIKDNSFIYNNFFLICFE